MNYTEYWTIAPGSYNNQIIKITISRAQWKLPEEGRNEKNKFVVVEESHVQTTFFCDDVFPCFYLLSETI